MRATRLVEDVVSGLVTLQERMVNLVNQLNMPLFEVSLVIGRHLSQLMDTLGKHLEQHPQTLNENVTTPWRIESTAQTSSSEISLDALMKVADRQRMDILETLIRVTLVEINISIIDAILALRSWEHLVRTQLAKATSPGQLFSPVVIPDDW